MQQKTYSPQLTSGKSVLEHQVLGTSALALSGHNEETKKAAKQKHHILQVFVYDRIKERFSALSCTLHHGPVISLCIDAEHQSESEFRWRGWSWKIYWNYCHTAMEVTLSPYQQILHQQQQQQMSVRLCSRIQSIQLYIFFRCGGNKHAKDRK